MQNRLKLLRKHLGISQETFASRLNLKRGTIAAYEVGNQEPSERTLIDIVRVFGVNEQWLRSGEGEMFPVPSDSSGEEFAKYAEQLLNSNSTVDQWTKELVVRWCKLTPERQKIVILTLHDLFGNDDDQKKLEELFPFI